MSFAGIDVGNSEATAYGMVQFDTAKFWNGVIADHSAEMRAASSEKVRGRYPNVSCSQCGQDFGPGDHGYSHCDSHRPLLDVFERALRDIVEAASDCDVCDLADIARRAISYKPDHEQ